MPDEAASRAGNHSIPPRIKAKQARPLIPATATCAALMRGGAATPARTGGDAVAALRQTADRHTWRSATTHVWQQDDVGTDLATPAGRTPAPPHLGSATCLFLLGTCA